MGRLCDPLVHTQLDFAIRKALTFACCLRLLPHRAGVFFFPFSAVPGRRQNTIVVKVPGQEDSHHEDGESGSEASDSVSSCGQAGSQSIGSNVTLITLNSEGASRAAFLGQSASTIVCLFCLLEILLFFKEVIQWPGTVAHACNPSTLGGQGGQITS